MQIKLEQSPIRWRANCLTVFSTVLIRTTFRLKLILLLLYRYTDFNIFVHGCRQVVAEENDNGK